MNSEEFQNRSIAVLGAASGIGRATALAFAARGAKVAALDVIRPKASSGAYAASKIALSHLVRVMAVELASTGITVNAIAPATVDTPMTQPFMRKSNANHGYRLSGTSPMGRIAQPEDIAEACLFLSSQASTYITGITMPVDGGSTAAMPRA